MTILTINGENLDVYDDMNINLNYQLNKISDLATRNSTFSNTITLPRTSRNALLFENLGMIGNTSKTPYKKVPCTYIQNDIPLLTNGYLQVTDTTPDTFKVVMYSGIIDMVERLNGKNIEDLNFQPYDHDVSKANYLASFDNTDGYIYAVGNFGNGIDATSPIQIEYQAPSFYMHTIWDMILTEAGYTYSGDIFDSEDFKNKVVTPTDGWEVPDDTTTIQFLGSYKTKERTVFEQFGQPTTKTYPLEIETVTPGPGFTLMTPNTLRVDYTGQVRFDLSATVEITEGDIAIQYLKNGNQFWGEMFTQDTTNTTTTRTLQVFCNDGDIITINAVGYSRVNDEIHHRIRFKIISNFTSSSQNIAFSAVFDGPSQTEFIKDVMQKYGLILKIDDDSHLTFITMEELLADVKNAENWTSKYISTKNEDYVVPSYGINNWMRYKYVNNEDYILPYVALYDGKLIIDNQHLEFEKTIFTSLFTARYFSFYKYNNSIWDIPLWKRNEKSDDEIEIKKNKAGMSIFQVRKSRSDLRIKLFKNGTATPHKVDVPFLGQEEINYQNFIEKYYTNVNVLLNRNKIVTIEMNLNEEDLRNLDFFKLKFLEQTGKFYYLNSVKAPSKGITTVELVEINNNEYKSKLMKYNGRNN